MLHVIVDIVRVRKAKSLYRKYNRVLFDNKLPSIPFKLNCDRYVLGQVLAFTREIQFAYGCRPHVLNVKFQCIKLSHEIFNDENLLHGVLIHEMIHIKLMSSHIIETSGHCTSHGNEFLHLKNKIQEQVDFRIPV